MPAFCRKASRRVVRSANFSSAAPVPSLTPVQGADIPDALNVAMTVSSSQTMEC